MRVIGVRREQLGAKRMLEAVRTDVDAHSNVPIPVEQDLERRSSPFDEPPRFLDEPGRIVSRASPLHSIDWPRRGSFEILCPLIRIDVSGSGWDRDARDHSAT